MWILAVIPQETLKRQNFRVVESEHSSCAFFQFKTNKEKTSRPTWCNHTQRDKKTFSVIQQGRMGEGIAYALFSPSSPDPPPPSLPLFGPGFTFSSTGAPSDTVPPQDVWLRTSPPLARLQQKARRQTGWLPLAGWGTCPSRCSEEAGAHLEETTGKHKKAGRWNHIMLLRNK